MRKIKRLLISVLVASMFMQFVPISNLGVKVYVDETPENPDNVEETEGFEKETGEPIEEPTEESEGTEEAGIPILLSAGAGAKAGKYVVTLQPIQKGSSDF